MDLRPNEAERAFLSLAYNRFYDIQEQVVSDDFWKKDEWYRFSRVREAFSVYSELMNYEPIKWFVEDLKHTRPPMEAEIGSDLFRFVRNVVQHFPFFDAWDQVWVNKQLVNWCSEGKSVDKFLNAYAGKAPVKYRFWEPEKKRMTYLSINFPKVYSHDFKIYLKDILSENEGVKFSFILMRQIIDSQVKE